MTKGYCIKEKNGKLNLTTFGLTELICEKNFHLSLDDMADFDSQTKGTKVVPVSIREIKEAVQQEGERFSWDEIREAMETLGVSEQIRKAVFVNLYGLGERDLKNDI